MCTYRLGASKASLIKLDRWTWSSRSCKFTNCPLWSHILSAYQVTWPRFYLIERAKKQQTWRRLFQVTFASFRKWQGRRFHRLAHSGWQEPWVGCHSSPLSSHRCLLLLQVLLSLFYLHVQKTIAGGEATLAIIIHFLATPFSAQNRAAEAAIPFNPTSKLAKCPETQSYEASATSTQQAYHQGFI